MLLCTADVVLEAFYAIDESARCLMFLTIILLRSFLVLVLATCAVVPRAGCMFRYDLSQGQQVELAGHKALGLPAPRIGKRK